jgi:hypothetical protein
VDANGTPNAEGTVDDHRRERRPERGHEQRLTLSEAAQVLGTSKDALRMRVKRGTLRAEKGEDGRVHVWVNVSSHDDPNTVHPQVEAEAWRELIAELRDRVRSLEDANRENRRIIAALTQRIPEIEAPSQEPRESPLRHGPGDTTTDTTDAGGGPQRDTERSQERRPWWSRIFGS